MFVSYRWLQDYVDIADIEPQELAEKITRSGIEVDSVESLNKGVSNVIVGKVVDVKLHPNADKLKLCQVDTGEGTLSQIVCGAPNVCAGQKVAVAKPGARLPGGIKIKKAKLRGEESHGMICSLQELGVESHLVQNEYADGIFEFSDQVEVGNDAIRELNLNDTILEFDLTPNRADCLSMLGVAYEVAAILDRDVKKPAFDVAFSNESAADYIRVSIDSHEDNPYYGAFVVKNVKVAPSPLWLINRLVAAGIRPINNVVDITNFVLLEYGQPLHAFDYDRLGSKEIVVRRAKQGEEIITLDDETRHLSADHLVITNGNDPVAVAGVMGGASAEVRPDTTTILLEAAYFDSKVVRKASTDLGLSSEASTRFEKGVARNRVYEAGLRAVSLMKELAGGEVLSGVVEAGERNVSLHKITIEAERINRVLGTTIRTVEMEDIFRRLGFEYQLEDDTFTVTIPTRRPDIRIQEDLIEEVARLYGYEQIPTTLPVGESHPGRLSDHQKKRRIVRRYLEGVGIYQATTYSLTTLEKNRLFGHDSRCHDIGLTMPMSEERSHLRTFVLPHLLEALAHNLHRQETDVALYEIGSVFLSEEKELRELPKEEEHLAAVFTGVWLENKWQNEVKTVDFFVVKGVLEGLFEVLGFSTEVTFEQARKEGLHPGRAAIIKLNENEIGFIGQLHPSVQQKFDLNETYVFELSLEALLNEKTRQIQYDTLPRYPSVTRDIALVVEKDVKAGDVKEVIFRAGGRLLNDVKIFDVYEGEHVGPGKKSLAFSLLYLDPEHTLTEEEVNEVHTRVLDAVREKFSAELRQ